MSLKDSLQQKLETQTEHWSKQVQALQAEADEKMAKAKDDQAEAQIQKEMSEKIESLENQIEEARVKLSEIKDSGEDKLSELKATIEDWLKVFEDATGRDLTQFKRWYSQAGTPHVAVSEAFADGTYTLTARQQVDNGQGSLAMDGYISEIGPGYFTFRGTITIEGAPDRGRTRGDWAPCGQR